MANWMKLQVDGGRLNGVQVIPENIIRESHTPASLWPGTSLTKPPFPISYSAPTYSLGFAIGQYRGKSIWTLDDYLNGLTVLHDKSFVGLYWRVASVSPTEPLESEVTLQLSGLVARMPACCARGRGSNHGWRAQDFRYRLSSAETQQPVNRMRYKAMNKNTCVNI